CTALVLVLRSSTGGALTASTLWLVGFGAIPVFCTAACLRTGAVSPDLASAVNNAASNVGIGLGAAVGGAVFAVGAVPAVAAVSAVAFAAAGVLVLVQRRAFPVRPTPSRA